MKKYAYLPVLILLLFSGFIQPETILQQGNDRFLIGPEKFKNTIDKKPLNVIIIDVRTPEEYNAEKIEGAIIIDYKNENFKEKITELDKSKVYFIYCRSGRRSSNSRIIMNDLGIKNVFDLEGGILAWKEAKYPVEQ
jgi:rhodanese-related sulfurtransferase